MRAFSILKALAVATVLAASATAAKAESVMVELSNASLRANGGLNQLNYSSYTGTLQVNIDNGGGLFSNGNETSLKLTRGANSQTFFTNSGTPYLLDGNVVGSFVFGAPNTLSSGTLTFHLSSGDDFVVGFAGKSGALYLEPGPVGQRLALSTTVTSVTFPTNYGGFDLSGLGAFLSGSLQELKINALTGDGSLTDANADTRISMEFGRTVGETPVVPVPAAMPAGAMLLAGLGAIKMIRSRRRRQQE